MKKYLLLICFIIVFGFAILSGGTKYVNAGIFIIALFFCVNLIKNIHTYNESRSQISGNCINLKRNNVVNTLLIIVLLLLNDHKKVLSIKNTENIILVISLYMVVVTQLIITIFCIPKLSTEGFISSTGRLIGFNKIKNIKSERGIFISYKRLTVKYEKNSEVFKVHFLDYENIKKYVQTYGNIVIEEKD